MKTLQITGVAAVLAAGLAFGAAQAAEVNTIAGLTPEEGTDFGWNQQGVDAAKAAGEATLGKRPYTDLREGKVTLPLLLTLKRCAPAEREAILSVLKAAARLAELDPGWCGSDGAEEALDLGPVLELIARYNGVTDTLRRADQHVQRAEAIIRPFPDCRAKQDMLAAARYSAYRDR